MSEHRNSTGEGIWIGLCVALLLLTAAAGGFGFIELRQARLALKMEREMRRAVEEAAAEHARADMRAAEMSMTIDELQHRVVDLEAENQDLRQRLQDAGK